MIIYRYIDSIVDFGLEIINFLLQIYLFFCFRIRRLLKRNTKLKSLKRYDECFILGNGPSLKTVDLDKLREKDTFVVNYFFKYKGDEFKSRYFVAVDDIFENGEARDYIESLYTGKSEYYFLRYGMYFNNRQALDIDKSFFLYAKQFQTGNKVRIECDKNMTACINVVLQCIQIALYMGYKKIYLLGCEFSEYATLKTEHFYDDNSDRLHSMGDEARWAALVHYHHYALRKYANDNGVEIINLTPNSMIDAYPKKSIEEVLNEK